MIERVLAHLGAHGVDEAVLSLGYRPDAFIDAYPDDVAAGVRLDYAVRARAARHRRCHRGSPPAQAGIDETFVVVNGDVLTDLDISRAGRVPPRATAPRAPSSSTPVDDPSRFGVVPTDADGRVLEFIEKPPADAGAHQPDQRRDLRARAVGPRRGSPSASGSRSSGRPSPRWSPTAPLFAMAERRLLARHRDARRLPAGQRRPARRHPPGPPCPGRDRARGGRGVDASVRAGVDGDGARAVPARRRRAVVEHDADASSASVHRRRLGGRDAAHRCGARSSCPGRGSSERREWSRASILGHGCAVGAECERVDRCR